MQSRGTLELIVDKDLRNQASGAEKVFLLENIDAWRVVLVRKIQEVEAQLALRKTYPETREHREWRNQAVGFKKSVDRRLSEVKEMVASGDKKTRTFSAIAEDMLIELTEIKELLQKLVDRGETEPIG